MEGYTCRYCYTTSVDDPDRLRRDGCDISLAPSAEKLAINLQVPSKYQVSAHGSNFT